MKLKDKVAIVTGDSSGSGRATAVAMAKEGDYSTPCRTLSGGRGRN